MQAEPSPDLGDPRLRGVDPPRPGHTGARGIRHAGPVAGGTTTVALKSGFTRSLRKDGVKILGITPATVEGNRLTLPIEGGSFDPVSDQGDLTSGGGVELRLHKKAVAMTNLAIDTASNSLSATLGGRTLTLAWPAGLTFGRAEVGVKKLYLTAEGAEELDAALGPGPQRHRKRARGKALPRAPRSAGPKALFKAGQLIGHAAGAAQPRAVTLVPGGELSLTTEPAMSQKLARIGVAIEALTPTTGPAAGPTQTFSSPIEAGELALDGSAGAIETTGGVKLVQDLETFGAGVATLGLGDFWLDLGTNTASNEVTGEATIGAGPVLGALGRSSTVDIDPGPATSLDPATRTLGLEDIAVTTQSTLAETLNSVFVTRFEAATRSTAGRFAAGEQLGTLSLTAQGQ